jgi:putative tryptophan/tyrosine transport system substrate-binding protein
LNVELGPKRLQLLHELLPGATIMALLVNPTNPAAAGTLGVRIRVLHASTERDFE